MMRSLFGMISAIIAVGCLACIGVVFHHHSSTNVLAEKKGDDLSKFVHSAEFELRGLEMQMPQGAVARSFPREERELQQIFSHGIKELNDIEKQGNSVNHVTQAGAPRHERRRETLGIHDACNPSMLKIKSSAHATTHAAVKHTKSTKISSLAARHSKGHHSSSNSAAEAARRQRQLDINFEADSKENKALSNPHDVDALFKSLNDAPTPDASSPKSAQAAASSAKKARTDQLAMSNSLEVLPNRRWGTVYDPTAKHARQLGSRAARRHDGPLTGQAAKDFGRWSKLAQSVDNVYDPTEDHSEDFHSHRSTSWWKWSRNAPADQWWKHNHAGRGY